MYLSGETAKKPGVPFSSAAHRAEFAGWEDHAGRCALTVAAGRRPQLPVFSEVPAQAGHHVEASSGPEARETRQSP